jgi:hypothetical protein
MYIFTGWWQVFPLSALQLTQAALHLSPWSTGHQNMFCTFPADISCLVDFVALSRVACAALGALQWQQEKSASVYMMKQLHYLPPFAT